MSENSFVPLREGEGSEKVNSFVFWKRPHILMQFLIDVDLLGFQSARLQG